MTNQDLTQKIAELVKKSERSMPLTDEEREFAIVERFFKAIDVFYDFRQSTIENYVDGSNMAIPQFDIAKDVMPDVFSNSDYSETAKLRPKKEENKIIARLIDKDLSEEPATIIDIGTYDWERSKEIFDLVKNKENVSHYIGIDTNPISKSNIPELGVNTSAITDNFLEIMESVKKLPGRKLYLFSDNVLMNITNKKQDDYRIAHEGISSFLPTLLESGDSVIGETRNYQDQRLFVNGIEDAFINYHNIIKKYVGGHLIAQELHPDEATRAIILEDINEEVEFNGRKYEFKSPVLTFKTAVGTMETDELSKPRVFLGSSNSLSPNEHFFMSIMNLTQDIVLKEESDWNDINNHSIFRYTKDETVKELDDNQSKEMLQDSVRMSRLRNFSYPLFYNFTDLMVGLGTYPEHYNKLITDCDDYIMSQGMSFASKYFLERRKTHGESNMNMFEYHVKFIMGAPVEEILPHQQNNIHTESFINITIPKRQ